MLRVSEIKKNEIISIRFFGTPQPSSCSLAGGGSCRMSCLNPSWTRTAPTIRPKAPACHLPAIRLRMDSKTKMKPARASSTGNHDPFFPSFTR